MAQIAIAAAISLALTAASYGAQSLIASGRTNRVERGRLDNFNEPRGSYGDYISEVWGLARVGGILIWATFPPEERTRSKKRGGKGGGPATVTTDYAYFGNFAFLIARETTEIKEIRFNSKIAWKDGELSPFLASSSASIRVYNGDASQEIDSLLQINLGDRALAYRNRTYIVCENVPLAEFGNAYPQCSAIVRNGNPKLSTVIQEICLQSPFLAAGDIDVSELTAIDVTGFQIDRESSIAEKLAALQRVHFFDLVDTGEKLKFQKQYRENAVAYIPPSQLSAREEEDRRGRNYKQTRTDPAELPTRIEVKFLDANNNLLQGLERSPFFPTADGENIQTIDYPGALTAAEAKTIANRALWLARTRSLTQEISLPPRYANLEPGDVIEYDIDGTRQKFQIYSLEYGANHQILAKTWQYNASIYDFQETADATYTATATATLGTPIALSLTPTAGTVTVSSGGTTYTAGTDYTVSGNQITPIIGGGISNGTNLNISYEAPIEPRPSQLPIVSPTTLRILDIPPAYDDDFDGGGGLYAFADGGENWRNAALFLSRDGGTTYDSVTSFIDRSIFGACETTFDGTSVDVRVRFHAELESVSAELFDLGENRALVGDEIIDFRNASLQGSVGSDRIFRLSGPFRRGISGTPTTHVAGESFYLLSGYLLKLPGTEADIGRTLYFKAVSPGQTLADVTPVTITVVGRSFKARGNKYEEIRFYL